MRIDSTPIAHLLVATLSLVAGIVPATAPAAENYLPLVLGNRWTYRILTGGLEIQVVDREVKVRGRPALAILHTVDGTPVEEDYWSTSAEDVFYHGYYRPVEDYGILCEPPVKVIEASLAPGVTWSSLAELFLLPDTTSLGFAVFDFVVAGKEIVDVPAGSFTAFEIQLEGGGGGALASGGSGAQAPGGAAAGLDFPRRWVAANVGTVRLSNGVARDLESYSVVLPVWPATWGAVKWGVVNGAGPPR